MQTVAVTRCSQTRKFAHWEDPALPEDVRAKGEWVPEADTPRNCVLYEVRALNGAQMHESYSIDDASLSNMKGVEHGLVSIDGAACGPEDVPWWLLRPLADLIGALSKGPTARRPSPSSEEEGSGAGESSSKAQSDGGG